MGDVSFAGRRAPASGVIPSDLNPFRYVKARFEQADLVIANAEGLLTNAPPSAYGEARLNIAASPRWAPTYHAAGVDVVGLANNHSWDGGAAGVIENRKHLADTGLKTYGAGETEEVAEAPLRLTSGGRCVAVLPATLKSNRRPKPGASAAYYRGKSGLARLTAHIRRLAGEPCTVIVSVHWGSEGKHHPGLAIIAAAHQMIDAGAALVVGHHPHVLQGVEFYGDGAIVYSLGNFVFTNRNPDKRETGMLSVQLTDGRISRLGFVPAMIHPRGFFPKPADARQAERTAKRLSDWSRRWRTRVTQDGAMLRFDPPAK